MSTLRPSDNPVDFEKKNNKCGSLSHIITIYAVSSGLCREATRREILRRRSTTQADSIIEISFCCEISLRKQPTLLDTTSGFFTKRRRNKVFRLLSSPVLLRKFTNSRRTTSGFRGLCLLNYLILRVPCDAAARGPMNLLETSLYTGL